MRLPAPPSLAHGIPVLGQKECQVDYVAFPKIGVFFWGGPIIRAIVFGDLYWAAGPYGSHMVVIVIGS